MGPGMQEEDLMKCVICKKASTKPGTTTITFERDCLTMVVKCVPAQVCPNCKEAYISEAVTAELLKDAEERANTGAQVEIRQYVAA
jgi:YgiT-type zinc finger domain-containing protein